MKVTCQNCGGRFKIDDSKIPDQGLSLKCIKCAAPLTVHRPGTESSAEAAPPPTTPEEAAPPVAPEEAAPPPALGDIPAPPPPESPAKSGNEFEDAFNFSIDELDDYDPPKPTVDVAASSPAEAAPKASVPDEPDFSFDDAMDDLEGGLDIDGADTLPTRPTDSASPAARENEEEPTFFDEEMTDELPPAVDDGPGDVSEDDFSLDMPSLLENAAAELEQELGESSPATPPSTPEGDSSDGFEDDAFSFDDMLDQDQMVMDDGMTSVDGMANGQPGLALHEGNEPERLSMLDNSDIDFLNELPADGGGGDTIELYQVRRPNGKVFGPFPVNTIVDMIRQTKLEGTEEVSLSGGDWQPIHSVEAFRVALEAKKASGGGETSAASGPAAVGDQEKQRLAALEESRKRRRSGTMEVVSPMKQKTLKYNTKIITAVAVAVALIGVFIYVEFVEEVSIFDLITGQSVADKPLYEQLKTRYRDRFDEAQKAIESDSYDGYMKARMIFLDMLKVPDFRGVALIWASLAQVDYDVMRRFGSKENLLLEGKNALEQVENLPKEEPDILFAKGAELMYDKQFDQARDVLQKALISQPKNRRALHMIAEAFLNLPDVKPARKYLETIIEGKEATARTYYLQGMLFEALKETEKARTAFSKALEKDPEHLDSQIELAGLFLKDENTLNKAEMELHSLRTSFKEKLSKKQLARIHFYSANIYNQRNEPYKVVKELAAAIENEPDNFVYNRMLGTFYREKHECEKGQEQYALCIRNNPKEIQCHLDLARCLLTLNRPDQALFKLEDAAKIAPKDATVHYLQGQALENLYQPKKALEKYETAIKLDPNGVEYYTSAAMSYLKQDNITKAGEFIQKAKLVNPNSPKVHQFLGEMHLHQGDVAKAEEEFKRAIEIDPMFSDARYKLANTLRDNGQLEAALEQYESVLNLDDKSDKAYYGLGRTYYLMNDLDKAVNEYEKAVNLNAHDYEYFYHAGVAYFDKGNMAKAEPAFKRSLTLKPGFARAAFYLGRVNLEKKKYDLATEYFEQAIQLDKKNPEHLFYFAVLLEKQEKYTDALEYYDSAIALKEDYAEAYLRKGISFRAQNMFVPAIKMFRMATKLDPTINSALIELGDCYFEMRQYKLAIDQYKAAIKLSPENPNPYKKLGLVYQEMGKPKMAIKYLQLAIQYDQNSPQAHLGLGYAYKALRRKQNAIKEFETYLKLSPEAIDKTDVEDEIYWLKKR